jgi:hypothetical protein
MQSSENSEPTASNIQCTEEERGRGAIMFVCEHPFITQYCCRVISGKHSLGQQETANHHRK